jgi:ESCRT-II complex subunit VPS25
MSSAAFTAPKIWHTFPPFFTLQPTDSTRATQLEEWGRILLAHCRASRMTTLPSYKTWPLWENAALHRSLPDEGRLAVVNHLISTGHAAWADGTRVALKVLWFTVPEWAAKVKAYAKEQAWDMGGGRSFSFVELTNPARAEYVFYRVPDLEGLDPGVLLDALRVLEREGAVTILPDPDGGSNIGVMWKALV